MYSIIRPHFWKTLVMAAWVALSLLACSDKMPEVPGSVPLGDRAALEKLAASYEKLSRQLMSTPATLAPRERKTFVENVFKDAGYDYSITLQTLAQGGLDSREQYHHDLVELLFLPHLINRLDKLPDIYTPAEIAAIEKIKSQLK